MNFPPLPAQPGVAEYLSLDASGARLAVPARDFRIQALLVLLLLPVAWVLLGLLVGLGAGDTAAMAVVGGLVCVATAATIGGGLLMLGLAGRSSRKTAVLLDTEGIFRLADGRTLAASEVRLLRLGPPSPMMKWLGLLARTDRGETVLLGRLPPSRRASHEALATWMGEALGVPVQIDPMVLGMSPKAAAAFCYMPLQGIWLIMSLMALFTTREPAVRFAARQSLLYYLVSGFLLLLAILPIVPLMTLLPEDIGPPIGGLLVLLLFLPLTFLRFGVGVVAAWKAYQGKTWVIPGLGFIVRGWLPLLLLSLPAQAGEVRAQIDWQAHPSMHLAWPFFARGLTDREPAPTWSHQFRQTVFAPYLEQSGVRLFLAAAMAAERARNPEQARRLILRQFAHVEAFVADNPERFALARSPEEARHLLESTDKMVIVHSIEGGRRILTQPGDAAFWASQGVALVTLIHLLDDELGGAALNEGRLGRMINPAGAKKLRRGEERGLTERGQQALVELGEAGILVDLTHMSQESITQSLALMAAQGMPPVVTHGMLSTLTPGERAFSPEQVVEIYRLGGVFNLALSGLALAPTVAVDEEHCTGTLHSFGLQYEAVLDVVAQAEELRGRDPTSLAVGWSSDWNGWTSHSRPVYGPGRCRPYRELPEAPLAIDTVGLAHPGLLPEHWQRLEEEGADLEPMLRSAERFLQMWERARGEREG